MNEDFYFDKTKIFIVTGDGQAYLDYCHLHKLDPYVTFWDTDERIADRDILINAAQGLRAKKIVLDRIN